MSVNFPFKTPSKREQLKHTEALSSQLFLLVINGGYTSWSTWSECSATCGDGIRTRSRNCTNPEPEGGGKNCDDIGEPEEQELCDLPKCDKCKLLFVYIFFLKQALSLR